MNQLPLLTPWHTTWAYLTALPLADMELPQAQSTRFKAELALNYLGDVEYYLAPRIPGQWSDKRKATHHRDIGIRLAQEALEEAVKMTDLWLDNEPTHG